MLSTRCFGSPVRVRLWFSRGKNTISLVMPKVLERAEPLLALLDRHTEVVVRVQNENRRLHVLHVLERRAIPVQIVLLEDVAAEVARVTIRAVARAVVADEVRDVRSVTAALNRFVWPTIQFVM